MHDAFGRTIDYLRLSITDSCNYRCRYCMPASIDPASFFQLSAARAVELASACVELGIRKIRLTGGEPTDHPDIIALCQSLSALPGLEELCITTNGSRLKTLAKPLHDAGVQRVNISLDTLRPERFRRMTARGRFSDVWEGIAAAEQAGFTKIKLDTVLIGGFNHDEVKDFVELTKTRPWEVRFIELMPMGLCKTWAKSAFLPISHVLETMPMLIPLPAEGVALRYQLPHAQGTVGLISPLSNHFCADCRRIRITSDEKLKMCLHSKAELPLKGLSQQELVRMLSGIISQKPEKHHLNERVSDTPRTMNRIGG